MFILSSILGYVISVKEVEDGVFLYCDVKHRVLRSETAHDVLSIIQKANVENFKDTAFRELIGQVVVTRYNNNFYKIDDIDWDKTPRSKFTLSSGEEISFLEYYKKQYNITILDEKQPLLINRQKSSQIGKKERLICLVPEICFLTGLSNAIKNDFKIMKDISFYTKVTPIQRCVAFKNFLDNVRNSEAAQKLLREWGLSIADEPYEVDGRVLPLEHIILKNNSKVPVELNYSWNNYLRRLGVLRSINLDKWIFLYTVKDAPLAQNFKKMLKQVGPVLGLRVSEPSMIPLKNDRIDSYIYGLRNNIKADTQVNCKSINC